MSIATSPAANRCGPVHSLILIPNPLTPITPSFSLLAAPVAARSPGLIDVSIKLIYLSFLIERAKIKRSVLHLKDSMDLWKATENVVDQEHVYSLEY